MTKVIFIHYCCYDEIARGICLTYEWRIEEDDNIIAKLKQYYQRETFGCMDGGLNEDNCQREMLDVV